MQSIQGNREAQNRLRELSPTADHCHFLKENPSACTTCLLSPYRETDGPLYRAAENWMWLLEEAESLELQTQLNPGMVLTENQFAALVALRCERQVVQAMMLARIVGSMFGAKPEGS
jgi:hypothetical protein